MPSQYLVKTGERGYIVLTDENRGEQKVGFKPLIAEEFREAFVEIHSLEPKLRLVTCIEILSPSNKRRGTQGWEQYQRKRQALLMGEANLVELDLLRAGQRMPMVDPWPNQPYFLLVSRPTRVPFCQVLPGHYRHSLHALPIPLDQPDPDVDLNLQSMIDAIYSRYRYGKQIDYTRPLTPPLPDEVATWLNEKIHEQTNPT